MQTPLRVGCRRAYRRIGRAVTEVQISATAVRTGKGRSGRRKFRVGSGSKISETDGSWPIIKRVKDPSRGKGSGGYASVLV